MFFSSFQAELFLKNHEQIVASRCNTSKQFSDLSKYKAIQRDIVALTANTPNASSAEVCLFGSRVIGVAEKTSDLDIYVCIDGTSYSKNKKTEDHTNALYALKRALVKSQNWTCQMVVANAVVPVIKAFYVPMKLECDINIMNNLATESSKMFSHMLKIQPEAISLFHFIKVWLNQQKFKHFRNYTLLLLVIFFLQSKNLMPSGKSIKGKAPAKVIDGWKVQFDPNCSLDDYQVPKMSSYKDHIKDFFQFYKDHDYSKVMSTFEGAAVDTCSYKMQYPNFMLQGVYIADTCNKEKNCGAIKEVNKFNFIQLCRLANTYFESVKF